MHGTVSGVFAHAKILHGGLGCVEQIQADALFKRDKPYFFDATDVEKCQCFNVLCELGAASVCYVWLVVILCEQGVVL